MTKWLKTLSKMCLRPNISDPFLDAAMPKTVNKRSHPLTLCHSLVTLPMRNVSD